MDKHKLKTPLLIISVIAGIVTGTCILYYSQYIFIPYVLTGIICYLAAAGAIALLIMSRKGTKGKRYKKTAIATGIFNVVVVAAIVTLILYACGVPLMPLRVRGWRGMVGEFSYKKELKSIDLNSPLVKTEGFVNTEETETDLDENSVAERAKQELEDPSVVGSYGRAYDKKSEIWKVSFVRYEGPNNLQVPMETVYLTGKGVTLLITFDE